MTKLVIDAGVAVRLVDAGIDTFAAHELLAPTLIRSQTLSLLHEAVHRGELTVADGRDRIARVGKLPIRLLGDAVLRRRAFDLADELDWASTYDAEYVALTQLQGEAFVTLDRQLARSAAKLVTVAPYETLTAR